MVESSSSGVPPAHPQLLRVADAARMLSISRSLLYELMDRGQLPYTKLGRARRISKDEIVSLIARQTRGQALS